MSNGFMGVDQTLEDKGLCVFNWYCFNLGKMKNKTETSPKAGEETKSAVIPLKGEKKQKSNTAQWTPLKNDLDFQILLSVKFSPVQ